MPLSPHWKKAWKWRGSPCLFLPYWTTWAGTYPFLQSTLTAPARKVTELPGKKRRQHQYTEGGFGETNFLKTDRENVWYVLFRRAQDGLNNKPCNQEIRMKVYLLFFLTITLLFAGCSSPSPQHDQVAPKSDQALTDKNSELPLCKIETIESCEVESVGSSETIYRCNYCKPGAVCPDCEDHACENCSDEKCRCRLNNKRSP